MLLRYLKISFPPPLGLLLLLPPELFFNFPGIFLSCCSAAGAPQRAAVRGYHFIGSPTSHRATHDNRDEAPPQVCKNEMEYHLTGQDALLTTTCSSTNIMTKLF